MTEVWTINALKEHIDQRFVDTDRAINLAAEALALRLEQMNEFRGQILEERQDYARNDRVAALERFHWMTLGILSFIAVILPAITALIFYLLTK